MLAADLEVEKVDDEFKNRFYKNDFKNNKSLKIKNYNGGKKSDAKGVQIEPGFKEEKQLFLKRVNRLFKKKKRNLIPGESRKGIL